MRRFQFTAIDDATRVRALKIYKKHTQANALKILGDFVDHVIEKFPFRIKETRTAMSSRSNFSKQPWGMLKTREYDMPTLSGEHRRRD